MRILALDIATKTGWCIDPIAAGVEDFGVRRGESGGMRFLKFKAWLERVLTAQPVELVVYEHIAFFRGIDASLVYGGLLGQMQAVCAERRVEYKGVTATELKKATTGKGSGKKEAMIAAIQASQVHGKWFTSGDDNEADARALWSLAQKEWGNGR